MHVEPGMSKMQKTTKGKNEDKSRFVVSKLKKEDDLVLILLILFEEP